MRKYPIAKWYIFCDRFELVLNIEEPPKLTMNCIGQHCNHGSTILWGICLWAVEFLFCFSVKTDECAQVMPVESESVWAEDYMFKKWKKWAILSEEIMSKPQRSPNNSSQCFILYCHSWKCSLITLMMFFMNMCNVWKMSWHLAFLIKQ